VQFGVELVKCTCTCSVLTNISPTKSIDRRTTG